MITRLDTETEVSFRRSGGVWSTFRVSWRDELTDGTAVWGKERSEEYPISALPAQVQADLLSAWNGMKAYRDQEHPPT